MIPDRLQYFLEHFWNDQHVTKSGSSGPVFITNIFQKIQEHMRQSLRKYYFAYLRIWNSEKIGRSVYITFWNFGMWFSGNLNFQQLFFRKRNIWTFEIWNVNHLKLWRMEIRKSTLENLNFEVCNLEVLKIGNRAFDIWNFENRKSLKFEKWKL